MQAQTKGPKCRDMLREHVCVKPLGHVTEGDKEHECFCGTATQIKWTRADA